jgi:protein disulfide-isomerase A6
MKPDWDKLGKKFEDSKKVLIGDVDCTADGQALCEKYGVEGYPTIMTLSPPSYEPENYEGERTFKALKKFAKKLGPACTASSLDVCTPEQLEKLQPYLDMPNLELMTKYLALKAELDGAKETHETLLKSLQEQYETSQKALDALKEEKGPTLKLMKAAMPGEPAAPAEAETAAPKEEV